MCHFHWALKGGCWTHPTHELSIPEAWQRNVFAELECYDMKMIHKAVCLTVQRVEAQHVLLCISNHLHCSSCATGISSVPRSGLQSSKNVWMFSASTFFHYVLHHLQNKSPGLLRHDPKFESE